MNKLIWNVYIENFNGKRIEPYNLFNHGYFSQDVAAAYKKHKADFEAFSEAVKHSLMYYYWSKSEWEIIIGPWCSTSARDDMEIKVDVYDQVMLNWEVFINYVWEQLRKKKPTKGKKKVDNEES